MEDRLQADVVRKGSPWDNVPFIPYVYRGTGVDTMNVNLYDTVPRDDYTRCKRCGRSYKSKYHRNNEGGEHNAH